MTKPCVSMILSTETMTPPSVVAPPPWTLFGSGVVILYRFPKSFVEQNGFLAAYQRDAFGGVLGTVMLVDYQTSPVGAYRELLFIPGVFNMGGKFTFSISKIYVSSYDSVWNGIENWGIPKEHSSIDVHVEDDKTRRFVAKKDDRPFFEATISRGNFSFPLRTGFFPMRIMQQLRNRLIYTQPSAKGKAYFGKIKDVKINAALFPDLSALNPLAVLVVEHFEMKFPIPVVI